MKRIAGLAVAIGSFLTTGIAYADCPGGSFTVTPAGNTYSVNFDQMVATQAAAAICSNLTVATGVGPGVIAVYSAEYRGGFDDPNGTGRLTIQHNGTTESSTTLADPLIPGNLYYSHLIGTNPSGDLESSIELELLQSTDLVDDVELGELDYAELARANLTDIQTSVDQFAANHTSLITHLNATADLLTGAGQKLEQDDGVTALAGLGSFTLGATGRRNLDGGFTLMGGAAVFDQSAGGSTASGLLLSGSLRYIAPGDGFVRPYGEIGLISAPTMGLSFTRSYVTSTGTTAATGSGVGALYGGFVKGGALVAPNADNEIVFAATLAKDWLLTGAYTETLSGSNLFAASAPAQSSSFDTVKVGVDWTTKLVPKTELTLSAALGATIAENAVATNVAFAGVFNGAPKSEGFAEYGARVAYEIDPAQTIGAFIHGSTGQYSGTHVQVGGDFHVRF
jgi:hypothetical protein